VLGISLVSDVGSSYTESTGQVSYPLSMVLLAILKVML
jgi:hypothetical protein